MEKNKKGFTLVELLAVIIVLGIIVGIILLMTGGSSKNAKKHAEEIFTNTLKDAINIYIDSESGKLALGESWNSKCSVTIDGQEHKFSVFKDSVSFDNIIHSTYSPITKDDLVNPADKTKTCDVKDNINIYKDETTLTKYYYFTMDCLTYTCYSTNLPQEVLKEGSCGIVLPVCSTNGEDVVDLSTPGNTTVVIEEPVIPADDPIIPEDPEPESSKVINPPSIVKISSSKSEYDYGTAASATCSFSGGSNYIVQFGTGDTVDSISWGNDITVNGNSNTYTYNSPWKGNKYVRCRVRIVDGSDKSEWKSSNVIEINFKEKVVVAPTVPEVPVGVTISTQKEKYLYGLEKASVTCNVSNAGNKNYIYQVGKSDSENGSPTWSSSYDSNVIMYSENAWVGEKYIQCRVKVREGDKESEWAVSSNKVKVEYYEEAKPELAKIGNSKGSGTSIFNRSSKFFVTNCYFEKSNSYGEVNTLYDDREYSFYGDDVKVIYEGYEYSSRKARTIFDLKGGTITAYDLINPSFKRIDGYVTTEDVSGLTAESYALRLASGDYFEFKISNLEGGYFLRGVTENFLIFNLIYDNTYVGYINGNYYPAAASCYKVFQVDLYWSLIR